MEKDTQNMMSYFFDSLVQNKCPSDELIEIDTKDILFILENFEEKILF